MSGHITRQKKPFVIVMIITIIITRIVIRSRFWDEFGAVGGHSFEPNMSCLNIGCLHTQTLDHFNFNCLKFKGPT